MNVLLSVYFLLVCGSLGCVAGDYCTDGTFRNLSEIANNLYIYNYNGHLVQLTRVLSNRQHYPGDITFTLYTSHNQLGRNIYINGGGDLANVVANRNRLTYFITHGWMDRGIGLGCSPIRKAYLLHDDANVIVVDWSKYSLTINYPDAACKVRDAGREVANMIMYLYGLGLHPDQTTLVGHSLGAHVMGIAGYIIGSRFPNLKVKHIVGLDPALPLFGLANPGDGLTHQDARHVQIIHTNGGGLGYLCPHGHSDFFPNGGSRQIGCCRDDLSFATCAACSHSRAVSLFADSIKMEPLNGTKCASFSHFENSYCSSRPSHAKMGGRNLDLQSGNYYLWTGSQSPFSQVPHIPESIRNAHLEPYGNLVCQILSERPT